MDVACTGSPQSLTGRSHWTYGLSLQSRTDNALLCKLADGGNVTMLLIDWGGRLHHNDEALLKLRVMWQSSFDANARILVPVLSEHIGQNSLVW